MVLIDIVECTAVGNNIAVEAPITAENLFKKIRMSTARVTVGTVVSTHNARNACFYGFLKGGEICFVHIVHRCLCIKAVAVLFGARMNGIML